MVHRSKIAADSRADLLRVASDQVADLRAVTMIMDPVDSDKTKNRLTRDGFFVLVTLGTIGATE
jgi:hypothetical protein